MSLHYDVIVVGGGHAAVEAACASYRMGVKVALITISIDNIGVMSCNPAIGGIGKGTIVKEIDALDGIMARAADMSSINCKILNRSRGPAVWGWRAQIDRNLYKHAVRDILEKEYTNLDIIEGCVEDIILQNDLVTGIIISDGRKFHCTTLILATGTFMGSSIHIGAVSINAGRIGEKSTIGLFNTMSKLGFISNKLKTGTPPRIVKSTINTDNLEPQDADKVMMPFSYLNNMISVEQIPCFITYTNQRTHDIVSSWRDLSPTSNGIVNARGPRYCVSLEDKISRFNRDRHIVFLEPEGLDSNVIYPNGLSSPLPEEQQIAFVRTIAGLENAVLSQPGYAVEYGYYDPLGLKPSLATKNIPNLFLAGQINGTTGYEEAAGQGIIAGINAMLFCASKAEFNISRHDSLIGVMIDDLTSVGIDGEPYRMMTSRAESRLHIRGDNADLRLTEIGYKLGCVSECRYLAFQSRQNNIMNACDILDKHKISPSTLKSMGYNISQDGIDRKASDMLANDTMDFKEIINLWPDLELSHINHADMLTLYANCKYRYYINRYVNDHRSNNLDIAIPKDIIYDRIDSLSKEAIEKLKKYRPSNVQAASKIPGVTSAAISVIIYYLQCYYYKKDVA